MANDEARKVYESLTTFESTWRKIRRRTTNYPMHKRLDFSSDFDASKIRDIYDWIGHKILHSSHRSILDAGCGVGYGLLSLCRRSDGSGMGITISAKEVLEAQRNARDLDLARRCHFRRASFNDALDTTFDLITAVESIKHSHDLEATLHNLVDHLQPGGSLVIVEDFFKEAIDEDRRIRRFLRDWALKRAYTRKDYLDHLPDMPGLMIDVVDLDPYVTFAANTRNAWTQRLMHGLAGIGSLFSKQHVLGTFRGGLLLEQFYRQEIVTYEVLHIRKT